MGGHRPDPQDWRPWDGNPACDPRLEEKSVPYTPSHSVQVGCFSGSVGCLASLVNWSCPKAEAVSSSNQGLSQAGNPPTDREQGWFGAWHISPRAHPPSPMFFSSLSAQHQPLQVAPGGAMDQRP